MATTAFTAAPPLASRPRHVLPSRARRHRLAPCLRPAPRAVITSPGKRRAAPPAAVPSLNHLVTVLAAAPDAATPAQPAVEALVRAAGGRLKPWRRLSASAAEAVVLLPPATAIDALRTSLYRHGRASHADIVLQEEAVVRESKRLAVFDLDSTLIAQETIDELASLLNLGRRVREITHRAMNGEIGFRDALSQRVALLEGLPVAELQRVKDRVVFTPGAQRLVRTLGRMGCRTAVVSGGFHFLADHVRDVLGLDYSYANRLEVDGEGVLTGRTLGEVVDAEYKESTLKRLTAELGLRPQQVLAVGDGSNDLLMMNSAGTGVAFNAKPIVQDRAKCRVNQPSLANVLYLLGLSDDEITSLEDNTP